MLKQILILSGMIACMWTTVSGKLPEGYQEFPGTQEKVRVIRLEPEVRSVIVLPPKVSKVKPTRLVFFFLPNGNSIEMTAGSRMTTGLDWHYDIQHIAAQTRVVRKMFPRENLVIAYMEANKRSWPTWAANHPDYIKILPRILDETAAAVPCPTKEWVLAAHSGGGGAILRYLESFPEIPSKISRLIFLDAIYNYTDEGHGTRLVQWLKSNPKHTLSVISYDDRDVKLDGKNIVSPTGGTWRKTENLARYLQGPMALSLTTSTVMNQYQDSRGQVDLILLHNPDLKILHTVLVGPKNGFIHGMITGTPLEKSHPVFNHPPVYLDEIQSEPLNIITGHPMPPPSKP